MARGMGRSYRQSLGVFTPREVAAKHAADLARATEMAERNEAEALPTSPAIARYEQSAVQFRAEAARLQALTSTEKEV